MNVIRFILSWLVAISLVGGAPALAAMAAPAPAKSSECSMAGDTQDEPADQGKMACCTANCTMAGAIGLTERSGIELAPTEPAKPPMFLAAAQELDSLELATVDPPPRRLPS